jgi:putative transposase
MHAVWTLPDSDRDYSRRWSVIKRRFTQQMIERRRSRMSDGDLSSIVPAWQQRFWAHRIDDELDYEHHVSYVHINPLKHALDERVVDWPWSSFHRFAATRSYPEDWGGTVCIPESVGRE